MYRTPRSAQDVARRNARISKRAVAVLLLVIRRKAKRIVTVGSYIIVPPDE